LEQRLGEIIPDVIVRKGKRDLLIEFVVTHKCGLAKIAKIKELNLSAVEVDLSWLPRNASKWDIREAIVRKAPRRWLYNPKIERERLRSEKSLAERAANLRQMYISTCAELRTMKASHLSRDRIGSLDLTQCVGIEVAGFGCFSVPPQDWQATILLDAIDYRRRGWRPFITVRRAKQIVERGRWLRSQFRNISAAEAAAIRADGTKFEMPEKAILEWVTSLVELRVLVLAKGGDGWILWNDAIQKADTVASEALLRHFEAKQ
jgi:hypothetical protein